MSGQWWPFIKVEVCRAGGQVKGGGNRVQVRHGALSFWAGNGEQGHRGKVWAEGRKFGWCLNPWDSIVFEFIDLIGPLGRTRERGRTGPRAAIFRGRIAEIGY